MSSIPSDLAEHDEPPLCLLGLVGGQRIALVLTSVKQVLPMIELSEMPGGPSGLAGFANLGTEPVPVLRLRTLFGLDEAAQDIDHRIVLCSVDSRRVGLIVDEATGLGHPENLRSPSIEDRLVALEVVLGVGIYEGEICLLLDPTVAIDWLTRTLEVAVVNEEPREDE